MPASLLTTVPVPKQADLPGLLRQAIALGADATGARESDERTLSPLTLLAGGYARLVDIAVCAQAVEALNVTHVEPNLDDVVRVMSSDLRTYSAAAVRLAHRALENHARDVGYAPDAWVRAACDHTLLVFMVAHGDGADAPHPMGEVRDAAAALSRAVAACESDRMLVPGHVAEAVGHLLVLYLLARHLHDR